MRDKKDLIQNREAQFDKSSYRSHLAFNQQALWFEFQLNPDDARYNIPFALRIRSKVNVSVMQRAFRILLQRHAALRTRFIKEDKEVIREVHNCSKLYFDRVDASQWTLDELRYEVLKAHKLVFDLERGPLMRVSLFTRSPEDHILLFVVHHIAVDGLSLQILLNEFRDIYSGEICGKPICLPTLSSSYEDFVKWQSKRLSGPLKEQLEKFWRNYLDGVATTGNMSHCLVESKANVLKPVRVSVKADKKLVAGLKLLAQDEGATLFMVLLAAFDLLVSRYSGCEDVTVCTPTMGVGRLKFPDVVGYFVNPVIHHIKIPCTVDFREFLRRVKSTILTVLAHHEYPFQFQMNHLLSYGLTKRQICPVWFAFHLISESEDLGLFLSEDSGVCEWGDLRVELFLYPTNCIGNLQLHVFEYKGIVKFVFEYDPYNYDTVSIKRMAVHFKELCRRIILEPNRLISELDFLPSHERHQLLFEWNDTDTDYTDDSCLHELFEAQSKRTPDSTAVVFDDNHLTYEELNKRANQLGHYLKQLDVSPEVIVGICLDRSVEMVVALLGILKAGGAYLPLDPEYPQERLSFMLEDAHVSVVLTQEKLRAYIPNNSARAICLDSGWADICQAISENLNIPILCDNLAYVIYTSGSIGVPKGVMISHGSIRNRLFWMQDVYHLTESDRVAQKTPFGFDVSVWEFFWPLLTGASLVLARPGGHKDNEYLVEFIAREQISIIHFVPSMLQVFVETAGLENCSCLREVICSGEALWPELCDRFLVCMDAELHNLYGPTEASVDVTYFACRHVFKLYEKRVPIGRPISNISIYILDTHYQPVPIGITGGLYIGGIGLARGYLNQASLTAERFIPNSVVPDAGARLYESGDLARYLPDGEIDFLGRVDHQVKLHGFRIELGEIELVLSGHDAIVSTAVLVREDIPGDKRLVAYIVCVDGQVTDTSQLRSYLSARLPDYMIPSVFIALESLPLTPNGKLDRKSLPAPDGSYHELAASYVEPSSSTEKVLAQICSEVLGCDRVGIHDNFFEVGGDSILAIQVISRARQSGIEARLIDLFEHPTIAGLASVSSTEKSLEADQGVVTGLVPLTAIQEWFFEQDLGHPYHFNQSIFLEIAPELDSHVLKQSLGYLLSHHDALRMRYVRNDLGSWRQVNIPPSNEVPFSVMDVSDLDAADQCQMVEQAAVQLQLSLDLSRGPLMRMVLFNYGLEKPSRLLWVSHHLVIDVVSWRLLLEDLGLVCQQLREIGVAELPAKTTSFKEWAICVKDHCKSEFLKKDLEYWHSQEWSRIDSLPIDLCGGVNTFRSVKTVCVSLDTEQTMLLFEEVPGVYHTQINDVLLAALVDGFSRWTGQLRLLVDIEGHGREAMFEHLDVSRTVGWFTSLYPVVLDLEGVTGAGERLKSMKEQLWAVPSRGIGYGLLRYVRGDEEIADRLRTLPQAEVSFNYLGQLDQSLSHLSLFKVAAESTGANMNLSDMRRYLLDVNGFVKDGQLQMNLTYSEAVHRRETMEHLADSFLEALKGLIKHCLLPDAGGFTPSDFPLAQELDQKQIDSIQGWFEGA